MPPKFAIPEYDKFNESGDPKQHIRQHLSVVKYKGFNEEQVLHDFPFSLLGFASKWYYSLELGKNKIWGELVDLFLKQFANNTMIDVTLRDLETTKRKNETFFEFLIIYMEKASKMVNSPTKKD